MIVTDIYTGGEQYTPEAARDQITSLHSESDSVSDLKRRENTIDQLRMLAGLCNSGEFDAATMHLPIPERKINGDATDQALLRLSESLGSVAELRREYKKTFEIAFNSKNKFMVRLVAPAVQDATSNNT